MASKKFNVGVIGYGLSAKIFHIPFINAVEDFSLYAIVQRNPRPEDDASQDHPGVKSYRSTEEMVQDANVDLVVVTTTPETHLELAALALRAKKHVIVEKPFTPTSAEAQQLVDLAKQQNVMLTVYQNRRFDSDFVTLQKYIKDGTLGRIVEFETHFDRHRPEMPSSASWKANPRPGVTVVYDLGSHLMDQVVHLFGLPQKITAFVGTQRENNNTGLVDSCTILLHYSNGLLATVKAGVVSPEVNQLRYWVRGTKGSFKKFHLDPQEDQLKEGLRPGDQGYGIEPLDHHATVNVAQDGKLTDQIVPTVDPVTYTEFYRKFALALRGDLAEIPVEPTEGAALIRLIELAHKSSEEGRTLTV